MATRTPAAAARIAPQRLPARAVADDDVGEVGREQEGQDQRVEGLRRPVEQHPGDAGACSGARARGAMSGRGNRQGRSPRQAPVSPPASPGARGHSTKMTAPARRALGAAATAARSDDRAARWGRAASGGKCRARCAPTASIAATKPVGRLRPSPMAARQIVDDRFPRALRHPRVDAGVGEDLRVALGDRDEDSTPVRPVGRVQVLGEELLDRAPVRVQPLDALPAPARCASRCGSSSAVRTRNTRELREIDPLARRAR